MIFLYYDATKKALCQSLTSPCASQEQIFKLHFKSRPKQVRLLNGQAGWVKMVLRYVEKRLLHRTLNA